VVSAVLENSIKKKAGRKNYLRGYYSIRGGKVYVNTTGPQGSGILRSMSIANCFIDLPSEIEKINEGEAVSIILIHHGELSHG
jgi:molybdopterin molybdotransferase